MTGCPCLFTDVDGTLLDADGRYAMSAAELAAVGGRLSIVLSSSRTVLELSRNQRDLGIEGAVVAENGAVVALPWDERLGAIGRREHIDGREWCVALIGTPAADMRGDVQEVAGMLGVPYEDQELVEPGLGRECSVLVRPPGNGPMERLLPLAEALRARGLTVASGGAWLAVTGRADKGAGVRRALDALARVGAPCPLVAAAGDGDNDVALLLAAQRRFVIARRDGTWHPALSALPGAECVRTPGIDGWRDVVRTLAGSTIPAVAATTEA